MAETEKQREIALAREFRRFRHKRRRFLLGRWALQWLQRRKAARFAKPVTPGEGQVAITYAGHSSVVLRTIDHQIVIDPFIRRRLGPIKRMQKSSLDPAVLSKTNLVLLSTTDRETFDPKAWRLLPKNATVICPPGAARHLSRFQFGKLLELAHGESFPFHELLIHACPVAQDLTNDRKASSYVVQGSAPSVYLCTQSAYGNHFAAIGRQFEPDIACLPISGYLPKIFQRRNMTPAAAVQAAKDLGVRMMIPVRYGDFLLSYEKLDDPIRWLNHVIKQQRITPFVNILSPGESKLYSNGSALRLRRPITVVNLQSDSA